MTCRYRPWPSGYRPGFTSFAIPLTFNAIASSPPSRPPARLLGDMVLTGSPWQSICHFPAGYNAELDVLLEVLGRLRLDGGRSGRPTHCPFRGLLGVHSRYGLHTRAVTVFCDTLSEGFSYFVTSTAAPVASGWSGCRVGIAPTGKAPPFHGARQQQTHARSKQKAIGSPRRRWSLPQMAGGSASALSLSRPAQASSRYGPLDRSVAQGDLCHEAPALPVSQPSRCSASPLIWTYRCIALSVAVGQATFCTIQFSCFDRKGHTVNWCRKIALIPPQRPVPDTFLNILKRWVFARSGDQACRFNDEDRAALARMKDLFVRSVVILLF